MTRGKLRSGEKNRPCPLQNSAGSSRINELKEGGSRRGCQEEKEKAKENHQLKRAEDIYRSGISLNNKKNSLCKRGVPSLYGSDGNYIL